MNAEELCKKMQEEKKADNRIIEAKRTALENIEVVRIIDSFKGDVDVTTFNNPTDVAISEEGNFFIADQGNARVLKLDKDFNYLMQFDKPVDNTLDPAMVFAPNKIVIDPAERVYWIASGINKGLIKYENDGTFSGFVGATEVSSFPLLDVSMNCSKEVSCIPFTEPPTAGNPENMAFIAEPAPLIIPCAVIFFLLSLGFFIETLMGISPLNPQVPSHQILLRPFPSSFV